MAGSMVLTVCDAQSRIADAGLIEGYLFRLVPFDVTVGESVIRAFQMPGFRGDVLRTVLTDGNGCHIGRRRGIHTIGNRAAVTAGMVVGRT